MSDNAQPSRGPSEGPALRQMHSSSRILLPLVSTMEAFHSSRKPLALTPAAERLHESNLDVSERTRESPLTLISNPDPRSRSQKVLALVPLGPSGEALSGLTHLEGSARRETLVFNGRHLHVARVTGQADLESLPALLASHSETTDIFTSPLALITTRAGRSLASDVRAIRSFDLDALPPSQRLAAGQETAQRLIAKLARLHSRGLCAGDTHLANLGFRKGRDPVLLSSGHAHPYEPGAAMNEMVLLLAQFYSLEYVLANDIWTLFAQYLRERNGSAPTYEQLKPLVSKFNYYYEKYYLYAAKKEAHDGEKARMEQRRVA